MGSPAMAMERPPMPPDVAAQMGPKGGGGAPPFAGVGAQMAEKASAGNPMKTALDATNKVWAEVIKGEPRMGPFVQRAMAILSQGLDLVSKGGQPGGPGGPAGPSENGGEAPPGPQPGQMPG